MDKGPSTVMVVGFIFLAIVTLITWSKIGQLDSDVAGLKAREHLDNIYGTEAVAATNNVKVLREEMSDQNIKINNLDVRVERLEHKGRTAAEGYKD